MEFLFDLLLTAFFSLFFAFFLSKIFSPSTSTSASTSSASHDAADVISGGAQSTQEDHPQDIKLREGEVLQEEKIIEVDKVVEKEAERRFLAEEARSDLSESVGMNDGKVAVYEGTELRSDDFGSDVEFDKEKLDRGLVQTIEDFALETSISSDREKEPCASEVGGCQVPQSSDLTTKQVSLKDCKLSEPEVRKYDIDNLCKVEGSIDKMSREVEVPTEETSCLKEEHEFNMDSQGSGNVQDEVSQEADVHVEVQKEKDEEHNMCDVEGPISKIVTEGGPHLEELTVPEEISIETTESSEQKKETETTESSEQKKGEELEEQDNLSKSEGPTSEVTQLARIEEKEQGKASIDEEGWEGVERTDTEKQFSVAAGYATSACGTDALAKLSNEVQLQLYGLHKVATEGPCYESHPMALRTSTRAKWHAWQKLGNMNPEAAMEEYLTLLSKNVPNWSKQSEVEVEHKESDKLTIGSGSCIEGPVASDSVSPGAESDGSIQ